MYPFKVSPGQEKTGFNFDRRSSVGLPTVEKRRRILTPTCRWVSQPTDGVSHSAGPGLVQLGLLRDQRTRIVVIFAKRTTGNPLISQLTGVDHHDPKFSPALPCNSYQGSLISIQPPKNCTRSHKHLQGPFCRPRSQGTEPPASHRTWPGARFGKLTARPRRAPPTISAQRSLT